MTRLGVVSDTHGRLTRGCTRCSPASSASCTPATWARRRAPSSRRSPLSRRSRQRRHLFRRRAAARRGDLRGRRPAMLVSHIRTACSVATRLPSSGYDLVITGHSHRFTETREGGVLYLNPGAAGAARFGLQRSVALSSWATRSSSSGWSCDGGRQLAGRRGLIDRWAPTTTSPSSRELGRSVLWPTRRSSRRPRPGGAEAPDASLRTGVGLGRGLCALPGERSPRVDDVGSSRYGRGGRI